MITEALRHYPGIGPARIKRLRERGVRSWADLLAAVDLLPVRNRVEVVQEVRRCLAALEEGDIRYLTERLAPADKWRVVAHFLEQTSFFDIETMGLEHGAPITVIACWHRGRMHTFVEHENLDDFLGLLDDVTLLASFNGSSFDVPRVLDAFHIPALPCPHIDLRWSCFHRGMRGSLKDIARRLGIERPSDLQDADGALAVHLWNRWMMSQDRASRDKLLRYCAADVLMLVMLAEHLAERPRDAGGDRWSHLPGESAAGGRVMPARTPPPPVRSFGPVGPSKLRALRPRGPLVG